MNKEFTSVFFQETKLSPPREQWFLANIPTEHHTIYHNFMNFCDTVDVGAAKKYMKRLQEIRVSDIYYTPIVAPDDNAKVNRQFHRGFSTDQNPIVYRQQNIPEFVIKFTKYPNEIPMFGYISGDKLTPGMKDACKSWFVPALIQYSTKDLLDYLVTKEKERYLSTTLTKVGELRASLNRFEDNIKAIFTDEAQAS
jgi:hypothetical protein